MAFRSLLSAGVVQGYFAGEVFGLKAETSQRGPGHNRDLLHICPSTTDAVGANAGLLRFARNIERASANCLADFIKAKGCAKMRGGVPGTRGSAFESKIVREVLQ
jgi:hypothetical protein